MGSSLRLGQIGRQHPESVVIGDVVHLLEDPVRVDVTVGAPGGAVQRPGLGLGARVPGVAVVVLAQRVLGVM